MPETFELMGGVVPTRRDKRVLGRLMGVSESQMYKWCEDPGDSGRLNPIDRLETIIAYALANYPDAALAITQYFVARTHRSLGKLVDGQSASAIIAQIQPASEKEAIEAVRAFTKTLRQIVVAGDLCRDDLQELLKEIEEGERQLGAAAVMVRALVNAQPREAAS